METLLFCFVFEIEILLKINLRLVCFCKINNGLLPTPSSQSVCVAHPSLAGPRGRPGPVSQDCREETAWEEDRGKRAHIAIKKREVRRGKSNHPVIDWLLMESINL